MKNTIHGNKKFTCTARIKIIFGFIITAQTNCSKSDEIMLARAPAHKIIHTRDPVIIEEVHVRTLPAPLFFFPREKPRLLTFIFFYPLSVFSGILMTALLGNRADTHEPGIADEMEGDAFGILNPIFPSNEMGFPFGKLKEQIKPRSEESRACLLFVNVNSRPKVRNRR